MTREERFPYMWTLVAGTEGDGCEFDICATCGATVPLRVTSCVGGPPPVDLRTAHHEWHLRRGE